MRTYLEVDLPQPLSTHLFLAFSQKPRQETPDHPKEEASNSEASAPGTQTSIPQQGRGVLQLWPACHRCGCTASVFPEHRSCPLGCDWGPGTRTPFLIGTCRKPCLVNLSIRRIRRGIIPATHNQKEGWREKRHRLMCGRGKRASHKGCQSVVERIQLMCPGRG